MRNKFIIIGGGFPGLALSIFLKKANMDSVVYEQAIVYGKVGRHFAIHPSGLRMQFI